MNGVNRISKRILDDARAEAVRIIEEAVDRARSLKEKEIKESQKANKRLQEEYVERAKERKRRMLAVAELEMRKELLSVKQDMINKAMEAVQQAILDMPKAEYRQIIVDMMIGSAQGDEEVFFSKADDDRLDEGVLDEVNKTLKEQGKKGNLKLSPEKETFQGGFILKSGGVEINNSFESIIRMGRDDVESQLAGILFQEEG
ncbi:MAG TPA: V-type ATP synthase subunit E family protein [Clostridia bacterium]|nr:V-type ATP synthase subunit E family protein [Clostridia bacterium]